MSFNKLMLVGAVALAYTTTAQAARVDVGAMTSPTVQDFYVSFDGGQVDSSALSSLPDFDGITSSSVFTSSITYDADSVVTTTSPVSGTISVSGPVSFDIDFSSGGGTVFNETHDYNYGDPGFATAPDVSWDGVGNFLGLNYIVIDTALVPAWQFGIFGSQFILADFATGNEIASGTVIYDTYVPPSPVPVPAAVWLFGTGLIGMVGVARRRA